MLTEEFSYFCNAPSTIECLIGILHRCFQKKRSGIKLPELKESAESVPPIRPARQPLVEHQWLRQFFRHCGELSPTTSRYLLNKSLLEIRYSSFHSIISLNGICFLIPLRNHSIFSPCFLVCVCGVGGILPAATLDLNNFFNISANLKLQDFFRNLSGKFDAVG